MTKKIGDKIKVPDVGMMGLETYIGDVVGVTYQYYIIDLGENILNPRFVLRERKDYE